MRKRKGSKGLAYKTFRGMMVTGNYRVLRSELIFIEYTTRGGKTVCSLPLPVVHYCALGNKCKGTCISGEMRRVVCNAKYHNSTVHNLNVIERLSERLEVDMAGYVPAPVGQVAEIAKGYDYFLWHFTGEIPSWHHLMTMIYAARRTPDTMFVCRTRLSNLIAKHVKESAAVIPDNLRIVSISAKAPTNLDLFSDKGFDDLIIEKGGIIL